MGGPKCFNLFVTSVEKDDCFLKIWGQGDPASSTNVERLILQLTDDFEAGVGVPLPQALQIGQLCCARYQDDRYYRARIMGYDGLTKQVQVTFSDYGNSDQVPLSAIRVPNNHEALFAIAPQATSYLLSGVVGNWDKVTLSNILNVIGYEEHNCVVEGTLGAQNEINLLKLYYHSKDYAEVLVSSGLGSPINPSQFQAMVSNMLSKSRGMQPMPGFGGINPYHNPMMGLVNPMWPKMVHNPMVPNPMVPTVPGFVNPAMVGFPTSNHLTPLPSMLLPGQAEILPQSQGIRSRCPKPPSTTSKKLHLEPNCDYKVIISNVEDFGSFAVQLKNDEEELLALMSSLNSEAVVPTTLAPPLLPGTKCLGRYSVDKTLCRAVLVGLEDDKCKLYYSDYGNSEEVDISDVYDLPPDFTNTKNFAVQFSLTGLKDVQPTDEMKEAFKEILRNENDIIMKVCTPKPEESHSKLYCELFIKDTNIKELVTVELCKRRSKPKLRNMPLPDNGTQEKVLVSYVKGLDHFYVQLASKQSDLEELMQQINKYCQGRAEKLQRSEIFLGAPCCALYPVDGRWYRAYIIDPAMDQLTVFYVDFGNEETVTIDDLCRIDPKFTRLRIQAICCQLYGFENIKDEALANCFEEIALEQLFTMTVVKLRRERPCVVVSLVNESGEDVSSLLKPSNGISASSSSTPNLEYQSTAGSLKSQSKATSSERPRKDYSNDERPNGNTRNSGWKTEHGGDANDRSYRADNMRSEGRNQGGSGRDKENRSSRYGRTPDSENIAYRPKEDDWGSTKGQSYFQHCDRTPFGQEEDVDYNRRDRGGRSRSERESNRGSARYEHNNHDRDRKANDSHHSSNRAVVASEETWGDETSASFSIEMLSPPTVKTVPVYMVYSINPSDFYLQLKESDDLSNLMERISEEYSAGGEEMSASDIKDGAACIAKYDVDETWYRAVIKKASSNSVDIFFPDYGNFCTVNKTDLKKIKPDFATLKGQAIHCSLIGTPSITWSDDDIAKFSALSESETLVATFLEKDEQLTIYKTILKDDNATSINESYGATAESMLSPSSIVTSITRPIIEAGSLHDVDVSWFINPSQFYVQLKSTGDNFKTLMDKLQKCYRNKEVLSSAEVGQMVVVKFKDDNMFYRAQIKIQKGNKFGVFYVDYGNKSLVDQIYGLEHQFATLPCQSILCSLNGVLPIEDKWPKDCADMCRALQGNISCTFLSGGCVEESAALVSLSCNGVDFSQLLVEKNLARGSEPLLTSEESVEAEPMEEIDLELLVGQIVPALATACSGSNLFVNFEPDKKLELQENIQSYCQQELLNLPSEQFVSSQICIAFCKESQIYKRAKIIDPTIKSGILVFCIDDGSSEEVDTNQIFVLPEELSALSAMAVECSVSETVSSEVEEGLKSLVNQNIYLDVQKYVNEKLDVNLLDATWRAFPFLPQEVVPRALCSLPVLRRRMQVCVSHACGTTVWLQQSSQMDNISQLLTDLFTKMEESQDNSDAWEQNSICAAKSVDGNWYRGIVEDVIDEGMLIQYVDYGNSETIPAVNLRKLSEEFFNQPAFALKASLPLVNAEDSLSDLIMNMTADKVFTAVFEKGQEQQWLVELLEQGRELSKELVLSGQAVTMENNPFTALLAKVSKQVKLSAGTKENVYVSVVVSACEIYVQLVQRSDKLESLQADLQTLSHSMKPFNDFPDVGTKCMALFEDETWYRGEVLPLNKIFFFDYGNTESIDTSSLKPLPPAVSQVEAFALKCCLLPPEGKCWSDNATSRLCELLLDSEDLLVDVLECSEILGVEFYLGGKSVSDLLAMEGLLVDGPAVSQCSTKLVFVSYVQSPNDFWVSDNDAAAKLDAMDLESGADLCLGSEQVVCGMVCAALFEDGLWYRAQVESLGDDSCTVRFIDYGNAAVLTQLKILPPELLSEPPLAKHCSLHSSKQVWSEPSVARFSELVADGSALFSMDILQEGNPAIVHLTMDGKYVHEDLLQLCTPEIQLDTTEAIQVSSLTGKAFVAYANAPSDFYLHLVEDSSTLEEIETSLHDAENFAALSDHSCGTICAALFPDDEKWYRAHVLGVQDEGFEVSFIDFGNKSFVTELRTLPESLQFPPVAKHCTLPLLKDSPVLNDAAIEKFLELTGDSETEFDIEFLSVEEPRIVNLMLCGNSIACELAELSGIERSSVEQFISALRTSSSVDVAKGSDEDVEPCTFDLAVNNDDTHSAGLISEPGSCTAEEAVEQLNGVAKEASAEAFKEPENDALMKNVDRKLETGATIISESSVSEDCTMDASDKPEDMVLIDNSLKEPEVDSAALTLATVPADSTISCVVDPLEKAESSLSVVECIPCNIALEEPEAEFKCCSTEPVSGSIVSSAIGDPSGNAELLTDHNLDGSVRSSTAETEFTTSSTAEGKSETESSSHSINALSDCVLSSTTDPPEKPEPNIEESEASSILEMNVTSCSSILEEHEAESQSCVAEPVLGSIVSSTIDPSEKPEPITELTVEEYKTSATSEIDSASCSTALEEPEAESETVPDSIVLSATDPTQKPEFSSETDESERSSTPETESTCCSTALEEPEVDPISHSVEAVPDSIVSITIDPLEKQEPSLTTLHTETVCADSSIACPVFSENSVNHCHERKGLLVSQNTDAKEFSSQFEGNFDVSCESEGSSQEKVLCDDTTISLLTDANDVPGDFSGGGESVGKDSKEPNMVVELLTFPTAEKLEKDCESISHGLAKAPGCMNEFECVEPGIKTYIFDKCEHTMNVEVKTSKIEEEEIRITETQIMASVLLAESDLIAKELKAGVKCDQLCSNDSSVPEMKE